jgi:hypothetical protein
MLNVGKSTALPGMAAKIRAPIRLLAANVKSMNDERLSIR